MVKLATIGDVLNITAALRALRQRYPDAHIDVLTTAAGRTALMRSAFHDEVIVFDKTRFDRVGGSLSPGAVLAGLRFARQLRGARYDTLVLLHHLITAWGTLKYAALALFSGAPIRAGLDNGRGWFLTHRALDWGFGRVNERRYWLDVVALLGATGDDDRPHFTPTEDDRAAGRALVAPVLCREGQPLVVIHPTTGAYAPSRQWPAERFAAVADRLAEEFGAAVVLVGGPDEVEQTELVARLARAPVLNLAGRTTFATLGGLLLATDLVVANDSSIGLLAAALDRSVVTIIGPSNDRAWAPYGAQTVTLPRTTGALPDLPASRSIVVRAADPHAPCLYIGYGPGNPHGCPHCRCLADIDADRVAALAGQLLTRATASTTAAR